MDVKLLGGDGEIGGNKILVEHKGTRIFLDFGMSFKQAGKFYSEYVQPRKCSSLQDFFEMGLLPELDGVYREDYLKHMGKPKEKRSIDGVFLSHAHADHAWYIHFLRIDIPIFCSKTTKVILQVLEDTGSGSVSDLVSACDTFVFYRNNKGALSRVSRKKSEFVHDRDFTILEPGKKVSVGVLEVEMVPVDHSLPGACGYIVYSDEGNLVYTGDIRFHGSHQKLSEDFVVKAKQAKPKILISEGTRIDTDKKDSEAEVKAKITDLISGADGLVFVEHPVRDLDRINTMYESAKANDREFVVNFKLAYLVQSLGDLCPFKLDDVKILVPKKSWGLIGKEDIDPDLIEQDYNKWERDFIDRDNSIIYSELKENPSKYVVSMNMWEINQLSDINPKNAVWIKSSCEPFDEEMKIDEKRKKNWLRHYKIKEYSAHASGHASGDKIREMIKEINPEKVIPIHTENPELYC